MGGVIMQTYNPKVIHDVQESVNQYIAIHKKMPVSVCVSRYEYEELKKAKTLGIHPKVHFNGKDIIPNVYENSHKETQFNCTARGTPYANYYDSNTNH
jgi:hypothetical protein